MKKISIIVLSLIMVLTLASCGSSGNGGNASGDTISVVLELDYPDGSGAVDEENIKLDVADGSTVLDVLNAYAKESNIEILMDEDSESPYVLSINGVGATSTAGWIYEVNDEMIMESADKHVVKDGDKIDWSFDTWDEETND